MVYIGEELVKNPYKTLKNWIPEDYKKKICCLRFIDSWSQVLTGNK